MAHLIDKSAVVAEIERKRNDYINSLMTEQVHVLNDVLDFLDTLEVKEADLEKEMSKYLGDDWKKDADGKIENEMIAFAKHFFELGLKAQKGE